MMRRGPVDTPHMMCSPEQRPTEGPFDISRLTGVQGQVVPTVNSVSRIVPVSPLKTDRYLHSSTDHTPSTLAAWQAQKH
jgi:hypothetical protein